MTNFLANTILGLDDQAPLPRSASLDKPLVRMQDATPIEFDPLDTQATVFHDDQPPPPPFRLFAASVLVNMGNDWFERVHVLPRFVELGNILGVIQVGFELYSSFQTDAIDFTAFNHTAGDGTDMLGLPVFPFSVAPQTSVFMTLDVQPAGANIIDGTLIFTTSAGVADVPITGVRLVMAPFEPEAPVTERLQFLTDVITHKDGTEQRVALRDAPRQAFTFLLRREDGPERQRFDFAAFDWLDKTFGLPIWTEPTVLTAHAGPTDTIVQVEDTTLSDFRVGGLVMLFLNETANETVEIESMDPTSITLASPIQGSYPAGTRVMPVRLAIITEPIRESRYTVNLADFAVTFRVLDNDDLGDTDGWPMFDGKVLLDDPNATELTVDGLIDRGVIVLDSETGSFSHASTWDRSKRGSAKVFIIRGRERLWKVRKLLHALRGRQVSFWLPTFGNDLTLFETYTAGAAALTVFNSGYARFVRERDPKKTARIVLKNGNVFIREIVSSSEIDPDREQLTLDAVIGQTIEPDDVLRIDFLEHVRIDTDEVVIEHEDANGTARVGFPVKVVFEE